MRRDQLRKAKRGVNLLLAQLKGIANDFDTAIAAQDVDAASACADPFMYIATILIRQLRDASSGTVATALAAARSYIDTDIFDTNTPNADVDSVTRFIADLISGRLPEPISTPYPIVAFIARDVAVGAATEIAKIENVHVNSVVAKLHVSLNNQGDSVQLSDREGANTASEEYASNVEMRQARQLAVFNTVNHWNDAANVLNDMSLADGLTEDAQDTLTAVSLMTVACAALCGGIYQLAERGNLYPMTTLLRQMVESEFIIWKFSQHESHILAWYRSTEDERRASWRPSTIYRDTSNEYRQKDYSRHCEFGGHPTPLGTKLAAGVPSFRPMAAVFADLLSHSCDAWRYLMQSAALIDAKYGTQVVPALAARDSAFETTLRDYVAADLYRYATGFFADPID